MKDDCKLETRGSFGRKYADCAMIDELPEMTSSPCARCSLDPPTPLRPDWFPSLLCPCPCRLPCLCSPRGVGGFTNPRARRRTDYHEGTPDWQDSEHFTDDDFDAYAWDNATAGWDETANFTGMDEYWAGMRQFDEGEEQVRDLPPISRPSPRKRLPPPKPLQPAS